jgi:hypothetical protein
MPLFQNTKKNIARNLGASALVTLIIGFVVATPALASLSESLRGFAWGGTSAVDSSYEGLGWVSMNNISDGASVAYGVHVPAADGLVTGYAWSEHYGWISFNGPDSSDCSPALSPANRTGNSIEGGARILSIRDELTNSGGFDGCISLSGNEYGIEIQGTQNPYVLDGYAWSSDLGWIDFSGVEVHVGPGATLSGSGCTIGANSNTCNGLLTWDIQGATTPNVYNLTSNTQYSSDTSGTNQSIVLTHGDNNVTARDGSATLQSMTIQVSCVNGTTWNVTDNKCVEQKANLSQPNVTYTTSPGFDPVTGVYEYIDINFQTKNDGYKNTDVTTEYIVQLDTNNDGTYDYEKNGTVEQLNIGQYSTIKTERVDSVTLGAMKVRTIVDSGSDLDELNESDNERVIDVTLLPPDPNMSFSSNFTQVSNGQVVTLAWNTNVTYSMNCRVYGPGIATHTFNPSVNGPTGNRISQPITSKSEFTLSCTEPNTNTTFTESTIVETQGQIQEL